MTARRAAPAAASARVSECVLHFDGGNHVRSQAIVVQRHQRVQRDYAAVGEPPPEANRRIEDVIALDLEEERALDLVRLRPELVASEEHEGAGERADEGGGPAHRPAEDAPPSVVGVQVHAEVDERLEAVGKDAREDERRLDARRAAALEVALVAAREAETEPGRDVEGTLPPEDVLGAQEDVAHAEGAVRERAAAPRRTAGDGKSR